MQPLKLTGGEKPETKIRNKIKEKLQKYGWHVMITHGNAYQHGFPDLYCLHPKYGSRWIEVKMPNTGRLTTAQIENFPMFTAAKVGIWILTGDEDSEIDKLFGPPNWVHWLGIMKP